jgi:sec-independent protein translocase protein TatB
MLDIGFSEILLIFVLGLIVLGPQKLPRVAAQVGRWIGRARAMARQFREQLEEEINVEETKKKSKPSPSSTAGDTGQDGEGGDSGNPGGGAASVATGAAGAAAGTQAHDTGASGGGTAGEGSPPGAAPSSAETPHLDLTNEPWPYVTPVPPPEVTDIFNDVLKTPVPGIAPAAGETQAGASEGAADASRVPPPPQPAPASQVHWPHDHEIPEATTEQVSPEAPLTTHERGP